MATTPKINLPLIDSSMTADVPRDMNALANAIDAVVETTAGAKSKADQALGSAKAYVDLELKDATAVPLNFSYGTQVVDVGNTSLYELKGLKGRTLVNMAGRSGSCESLTGFSFGNGTIALDNSIKTQGNNSIKTTIGTGKTYANCTLDLNPSIFKKGANKKYIIVADIKNGNATKVDLFFADWSLGESAHYVVTDKSKFITAWVVLDTEVIGPSATLARVVAQTTGVEGQYSNVDAIRVYEITKAEYDAIPSMTANQVAAKYPYVDSLQNVANPYAIGYGENLLPPFTEWYPAAQIKLTPVSAYEVAVNKTDGANFATAETKLSLAPNTDVCFSVNSTANFTLAGAYGTYLNIFSIDRAGNQTIIDLGNKSYNNTSGTRDIFATFHVPSDSVSMRVLVGVDAQSTGTFTFKSPVLFIGTEAKPFVSRQDSMLALTTEFASNVDGTVADQLFTKGGQYWKLVKFKRMMLDGSLSYDFYGGSTGVKVLNTSLKGGYAVDDSGKAVKFDGKVINETDWNTTLNFADNLNIGSSNSVNFDIMQVSVSNTDSGWGDSYTPTADEMKAYFNGWKMFDTTNGSSWATPYSRSDGFNKGWAKIYSGKGIEGTGGSAGTVAGSGITTIPTAVNDQGFTPYQLQYQLAQPTVEPVPHEGKLMLHKGANMVECGVGMEVREKVNVALSVTNGLNYLTNIDGAKQAVYKGTEFKFRVQKILSMDENGRQDASWGYETTNNSFGLTNEYILKEYFDSAATYQVSYTRLENNVPFAAINGEVAANLRGTVNDLVNDVVLMRNETAVAKQAGNDRKAEVVAALVAKGIAASTSDTWAQLISKMMTIIVVDGDATASDVLAGKKATNKNGVFTGAMPNLTGIRNASGVGRWPEGALAVYPEKGYQKGGAGDGEIKVSTLQLRSVEAYLNEKYIVSDASIFGVTGTAATYNYATGIAKSDSNGRLSIGPLSFTPNYITCKTTHTSFSMIVGIYSFKGTEHVNLRYDKNSGNAFPNVFNVTANQFQYNFNVTNVEVIWEAYKV